MTRTCKNLFTELTYWYLPNLRTCSPSYTGAQYKRKYTLQPNYRQDLPEGQLCRYCFYSRADFGFFALQGRHTILIKVKFGREERTRSSLPNFTLIGARVGVYGPPKLKKWNFTNIIAPKGRVPCTIFTKFTEYMRVLSRDNSAEFGCFISINDQISKNLLRWGRFQPNCRRPLAARL